MASDTAVARPRALAAALVAAALTSTLLPALGLPLITALAADYDVSLESAQWALTATLLVGALATPVLGRLGDGPRRSRVLAAGLGCVLVGCLVSATAASFPQMLAGRALQGVGYGTVPLTIAIARDHLTGGRQQRTIATLSITLASGIGFSYLMTGLLGEGLGVRAPFWFGAVLTLAALLAVLAIVPRPAAGAERVPLDVPGAVLLGGGLLLVLFPISRAADLGWDSPVLVAMLVAGLATLAVWVVVELRIPDPLVDVRLMRQRPLLAINLAGFLLPMGMFGALSLVGRLVQTPASTGYGLGGTALTASLLLAPLSLTTMLSQPVTRPATRRFGPRLTFATAGYLVAATLAALSLRHDALWEIGAATAMFGLGIGATFALMFVIIVACVPEERTGSAASLNQVLRNAGAALGSAVAATVLAAHRPAGSALPSDAGFEVAFLVAAACAAASATVALVLLPRRQRAADVPVTEPAASW